MPLLVLNAEKRPDVGRKPSAKLKAQGFIPAVLYGHKVENQSLQLKLNEFQKVFREAGYSSIIDLNIAGKPTKVLVHEVAYDVLKDMPKHVDFFQINMKEEITANINLKFIGKSKAITDHGAILVKNITNLDIKCLPDKLIKELDVDITKLEKMEDAFRVKDLVVPEGVKIVRNPNDIIALVTTQKVEEEVATAASVTPKEPELIKKKPKEEDVPAEGAEKAPAKAAAKPAEKKK